MVRLCDLQSLAAGGRSELLLVDCKEAGLGLLASVALVVGWE